MRKALVLGCDLTPDGKGLGPQTICRLERGLQFAYANKHQLVVAAGWSPRHPHQSRTMGELMDAWLCEQGYVDCIVLCSKQFRTKGEVVAFMAEKGASALVSDEAHLKRTYDMIVRLYGMARADALCYVPTQVASISERGKRLEPLKRFYIRHVPLFLDDVIWETVMWVTVKLKLNLSY